MSSKLSILALAGAILASAGCTGIFVPKSDYDRDVGQLKDYVVALERDNADLRPIKEAYERLTAEMKLAQASDEMYAKMAEDLRKALEALGLQPGDIEIDPKTGAFIFKDDVLFDSGKFEVTAKGREVLKKFAQLNKNSLLKIVGHTDPVKVAKPDTKKALFTDTNMELSALRAVSVWWELSKLGIPEKQMWVEAHGPYQPRSGGNKTCRRVEIFVAGQNGAVKTSLNK
jgi:flagellar motor protein MotB